MREHNGLYQAYVVSTQDPKKQRRLTARVPDVLGQTVSDWARPASIVDSPLPPGEMVWIHFPNGDIRYPVYHVPNDVKHGRVIPGKSLLRVDGPDAKTRVDLAKGSAHLIGPDGNSGALVNGDLHAKGTGDYTNVYALDFIKVSSAAEKQNIASLDFDPEDAIRHAPVYTYEYKANGQPAVGPLREDLPGIVQVGDAHVSEGSMIGILWAAVSQLSEKVWQLQGEVEYLRDELQTINEN